MSHSVCVRNLEGSWEAGAQSHRQKRQPVEGLREAKAGVTICGPKASLGTWPVRIKL